MRHGDRRSGLKKFTRESRRPASGCRESRARAGESIHVPGGPRKIASSSGVDNGYSESTRHEKKHPRKRARNGRVVSHRRVLSNVSVLEISTSYLNA